jgi:formate dehydrogenase gamma subunit
MRETDDHTTHGPPPPALGTLAAGGHDRQTRRRFNGVERAIHWLAAALFLALLVTGLALFHPQWRNWDLAGVKLVKEIHLTLGLLFVLAPLTAAAWDGGRSLRHDLAALRWRPADTAWLGWLVRRGLGRVGPAPSVGRFNAGQKLNAFYLIALGAGLVTTGGLIWPDRLLAPGPRALLYGLHDLLMLLSLPAVIGHIVLATLWPSTRPSLGGMLTGRVPAAWHRAHHPADPGPPPEDGPA